MSKTEPNDKNKKAIANEIVTIFKKIKISILLGLIFFIGYSVYNNLVSYAIFDKDFAWFEAEEILGYKPSQYYFVSDKHISEESQKYKDSNITKENSNINEDFNLDKELKNIDKIFDSIKNMDNSNFENSNYTGSMEINEEDKVEVKKEIINKLLENSILISIIMIPIFFIVMLLFDYINRAINWTKKHAD